MTDSKAPAQPELTHGVDAFKRRGKVPPGVPGRRRIMMDKRVLQAALEETRPVRTPQVDLLIRQIVRTETVLMLGFNWLDRGGILRESALRQGDIELQPILRELISCMNTQRLAILALGLDAKKLEEPAWVAPWDDPGPPVSPQTDGGKKGPENATSRDIPGKGEQDEGAGGQGKSGS
jgi:hypothetical protein